MSNRHHRRADLAKIKRNTPGALLTYLVEPDDPALDGMPLLKAAAGDWTGRLEDGRHCLICSSYL